MISKEEAGHIAKLGRLDLTEKEIEKMRKDISGILDYFNLLKGVKGKGAEVEQATEEKTTRQDLAASQSEVCVKKLLDLAPDKKDSHIKVRAIL